MAGATRVIAITGLAAVGALPFLQPSLTRSADGLLHLYRLVELDHCLAQGVIFPRWAPDLAQGYGFPLFSFYPPLAYYLTEVWHLAGLSMVRSFNLTLALCTLLSLAGAYLLARDLVGERGGLLAALLYAYAPISLYNPVYRGGPAEVLAWALAPLVLWTFRRLVLSGRGRWFALASLSFAALILAHHLTALVFAPLLGLFVAGTWLTRPSRRTLLCALAALLLAAGLSAFFAVPALLEKQFVQIARVYALSHFDFHNHFLGWSDLLSGPRPADPSLMNPDIPYAIGWPQLGLGLLGGLVGLCRGPVRQRAWYAGGLLVTVTLASLTQAFSVRVWEAIDILKYLQFPWRLLAPLSLVLALLGGSLLRHLPARPASAYLAHVAVALAAGVLFIYDTPLLYAHREPLPAGNPSLADLVRYERTGSVLGLTSAGDYLPIWVQQVPEQWPMAEQYESSAPINWVDVSSLPEGARIEETNHHADGMLLVYASDTPFRILVNQFYFPGWRAYVDGVPRQVQPVSPQGVLAVDLPEGKHRLQLRFEDTPLRRACGAASLLSLVAVAGVAWLMRRREGAHHCPRSIQSGQHLGTWGWLLLLATSAGYLAVKSAVLDPRDTPLKTRRLMGDQILGAQTSRRVTFGNEMELLGYDIPAPAVVAGDGLQVTLYWRALRGMTSEYSVALHLVDEQGRLWGQMDSWHPGGYPTARWQMDEYNCDRHSLSPLPGTPPGDYIVSLGVYEPQSGRSLDVLNEAGVAVGTETTLGKVRVTRPTKPPPLDALGMQEVIAAKPNEELELLGRNLPTDPVHPGQSIRFSLFWRATRQPARDYAAVASLLGANGTFSYQASWPVAGGEYPTSAWQLAEVIRAQYDLRVPAGAPPGTGTLAIAVSDPSGAASNPVTVGNLEILPVTHLMDVPAMERTVGADFGHSITLLGYDLDSREVEPGQAIHLRLYWQAQREMTDDLKVFTHLLDRENHVSAQDDSMPVRGNRPTTSWIAGEIVADDYELVVDDDAPTGEQLIEVGIYDPVSDQRLTVFDEGGEAQGDRVLLECVSVH